MLRSINRGLGSPRNRGFVLRTMPVNGNFTSVSLLEKTKILLPLRHLLFNSASACSFETQIQWEKHPLLDLALGYLSGNNGFD